MSSRKTRRGLSRRTLLRSGAVSIALPFLDAMLPMRARAEEAARKAVPRRMLLIARDLGLHAPYFFPEDAGKDYQPSRYLKLLEEHRRDFTVFSGLSHKGYPGGHMTSVALLTGVGPEAFRGSHEVRNTISLDQEAASHVGRATRFPYLVLGGGGQSWNRQGVGVPSETRITVPFKQLFLSGTKAEIAKQVQNIRDGRSILDEVRSQAKSLVGSLGESDRSRMDVLLTSIREAEQRLEQDEAWVNKPKPTIDLKPFTDDYPNALLRRERQWYDLVRLALQTDSTRVIALTLASHQQTGIEGVTMGHHDASHHGQDDAKLRQLAMIEESELKLFAEFLGALKAVAEGDQTLLASTMVFLGTNMGNASAHTCDNLPILLAGGGFNHAGHVVYDRKNNTPLSNLFVRMLRQMNLEADRFGSSTGAIAEI